MESKCKACGGEHHAVMPRIKRTYYSGRLFVVSTRRVPTIIVTVWQGNGTPGTYACPGMRQWHYWREDMFNAATFPYLAGRRG